MNALDKSQRDVQHPTKSIDKSKYFKSIIGLCILFSK